LQEIYYQNKSLNRTAQRISLIGLLGIVGRIAKDCAEREEFKKFAKKLIKANNVVSEGTRFLFCDEKDLENVNPNKI
jgi:hypothetical protein